MRTVGDDRLLGMRDRRRHRLSRAISLGAPISMRSKVIGFINLDSLTPGFYTPAQAERLQIFADQAAAALENARLYDTVQCYAAELEQRVAERARELTEANERLAELDRLKDKFVSHISHELRTPLANIHLYLELLEHGKPGKQEPTRFCLLRDFYNSPEESVQMARSAVWIFP